MGHSLGYQQVWVCRYHEVGVGGATLQVRVHGMPQTQSSVLDIGTKGYFSENISLFLSFQGMARLILMNL